MSQIQGILKGGEPPPQPPSPSSGKAASGPPGRGVHSSEENTECGGAETRPGTGDGTLVCAHVPNVTRGLPHSQEGPVVQSLIR